MLNVLVIGSKGFSGPYLVKALPCAGVKVIESCQFGVDLRDRKTILSCLRATAPDVVVNLAAISSVSTADVRGLYEVNAFGMLNLLEALNETNFRGRLVFASSANIYGRQPQAPLDESCCPAPANHYAASKLLSEMFCGMLSGDMQTVIVRPFNCIGVGQADEFLIPKIVAHFRDKRDCIELGNVDIRRDFSDIRDVADMYRLVITAPEVPPVIQFCSGVTWSIQEIITLLEKITGHKLRVVTNPALVRSNDLMRQHGSRRLLDHLGHRPKYVMEDTLRWMYEASADPIRSN